MTAGAGGNGGNGGVYGRGGGGGDGGIGVYFASGGTLLNSGSISGGAGGGRGSAGGYGAGAAGTDGAGVAGVGFTVVNSGSISGVGTGGAGIIGSNLTITNSGTVSGGSQAAAVEFTGGTNSLTLGAGYSFTGKVVAVAGGSDVLALGGDTTPSASFDLSQIGPSGEFQNFASFQKTGNSTWTLTGTAGQVTPWTIVAGTLAISSDSNLGTSNETLTFDNSTAPAGSAAPTLETTATITTNRNIVLNGAGGTLSPDTGTTFTVNGVISGAGSLTQAGGGTTVLTASNTFTGATTITGGTLALSGAGSIASSSGVALANNGILDISQTTQGASIQSLSDDSKRGTTVALGGRTLTLTNASGTFSGAITDGGIGGGTGGSLVVGGGTEVLSGANTYTGGTKLLSGEIDLGNNMGLSTGTLDMAAGTTLGFTVNGLNVANNIVLSGTGDPTINTGSFTETLSGVISGTGDLTKTGSGTLITTGANTYTGATTVAAGTLQAGATGTFSPNSSFTVASGATLDANGFNQTVAGLTNAGTVATNAAGTSAGTILTVTGNYIGQGGRLLMNTYLGGSNSPTDQLILNGGTASGNTSIIINNTGGLGAQTTGNGILLVSATNGATTTGNAFALGNYVAAGAYAYTLHDVNSSWYLNSGYRPEVPVDMAVQGIASRLGLATLGTLDDRTAVASDQPSDAIVIQPAAAATRYVACKDKKAHDPQGHPYRCPAPVTQKPGPVIAGADAFAHFAGWGRTFGEWGSVKDKGFPSSYTYGLGGFQAGLDLYRTDKSFLDGGRDVAGFYLGAGRIESDIRSVTIPNGLAGHTNMNGYTLGTYWTHYAPQGWYADAVLQGTRYTDVHADSMGTIQNQAFKTQGWGLLASLEGGYKFALGNGWAITPQAQVSYQRLSFDGGRDAFGLISYQDVNNGYGRLGVKVSKDWTTDWHMPGSNRPASFTTWARVNVWQELGGQGKTTFATLTGADPVSLKSDLGKTWGGINLGISGQLTETLSAFAVGDYNFALNDGAKGHSLGGKAGFKWVW
ncbi:autotransporter outer membrane beta-barrel domain-containing protein [Methylovirgula sp. 4M-Z18]|nr:autotransporter outer membrane beta-barrel domain-containing protein [Methylovirgula sp. 4M-Z18]